MHILQVLNYKCLLLEHYNEVNFLQVYLVHNNSGVSGPAPSRTKHGVIRRDDSRQLIVHFLGESRQEKANL